MKVTKNKKKETQTVVLGITVSAISSKIASVGNPSSLAQIVKCLKRHKVAKRLYFPLRGLPNGSHSFSVSGNHLRALFGEGDATADPSECLVLDDREFHKPRHKTLDNLGKCLLIEANIFIHRRS